MAPEVRKNLNVNNIPYNPFKADIYSLGVLFCELIGNDTQLQFNLDKLKGKTKLFGIIRECLQQDDPTLRPDISTIKKKIQEQMNTPQNLSSNENSKEEEMEEEMNRFNSNESRKRPASSQIESSDVQRSSPKKIKTGTES